MESNNRDGNVWMNVSKLRLINIVDNVVASVLFNTWAMDYNGFNRYHFF